jgi:hypothetical protein
MGFLCALLGGVGVAGTVIALLSPGQRIFRLLALVSALFVFALSFLGKFAVLPLLLIAGVNAVICELEARRQVRGSTNADPPRKE